MTVEQQPVEVVVRVMITPSRALDNWLDDLERRNANARKGTGGMGTGRDPNGGEEA